MAFTWKPRLKFKAGRWYLSWDRVQSPGSYVQVSAFGKCTCWCANAVTQWTPVLESSGSSSAYKLINCSYTEANYIFQKWHCKISGPIHSSRTLPPASIGRVYFSSPWIWARLRNGFNWWNAAEVTPCNFQGWVIKGDPASVQLSLKVLLLEASYHTVRKPKPHGGDRNVLAESLSEGLWCKPTSAIRQWVNEPLGDSHPQPLNLPC